MPATFNQTVHYPYPFIQVAQSLFQKYPNPYADHVISVDTLSCTITEDGKFLRTERLIGVYQSAPKWVMKMVGAQEEAYVREVIFLSLPTASEPRNKAEERPALLQASVNLSLSSIIKCKERISYRPAYRTGREEAGFTTFTQRAEFFAQGRLTQGKIGKALGKKAEDNGWDRFDSNAHVGRKGFISVLEKMWGKSQYDTDVV